MDSNAREDLETLVESDGWRRFTSFVNAEWGPAGRMFMKAVENCADNTSDQDATAKLRQVMVAKREIEKLLQWPEEQLKQLKQPELVSATADYSRRGTL